MRIENQKTREKSNCSKTVLVTVVARSYIEAKFDGMRHIALGCWYTFIKTHQPKAMHLLDARYMLHEFTLARKNAEEEKMKLPIS